MSLLCNVSALYRYRCRLFAVLIVAYSLHSKFRPFLTPFETDVELVKNVAALTRTARQHEGSARTATGVPDNDCGDIVRDDSVDGIALQASSGGDAGGEGAASDSGSGGGRVQRRGIAGWKDSVARARRESLAVAARTTTGLRRSSMLAVKAIERAGRRQVMHLNELEATMLRAAVRACVCACAFAQ